MDVSFSFTDVMFNDFDRYASFIRQADIEHSQLSIGKFNGRLKQLLYGPVILSCHSMNRTILQKGVGLEGFTTFLIPGNMNQDFIWRKNRLKGDVLGILKSGMEHNCVTKSNFFGVPVSIANNYLRELSFNLGYPNFMKAIDNREAILISSVKAFKLHQIIKKIVQN